MSSEIKVLFKNLYAEEILVSIAFHTVEPPLKFNFQI